MKTGTLLNALIDIAEIQKTDFALSMNMTPSGLSKILTGKRLPFLREKEAFSRQAGAYFAEAIFCYGCYLKFGSIFPVIYDFNSKYELEVFLASAIEYALDGDYLAENGESPDYPYKESGFLGKKTMLNLFCVILSDYINEDREARMEFYSALPVFDRVYADVFGRIRVSPQEDTSRIAFHHLFEIPSLEASYGIGSADLLSYVFNAEQYTDLNLWETEKITQSPFLLLKGRFLLIFTLQIDGKTPLMTLVRHKAYLTMFYNNLMRGDARKISYNRKEAIRSLEADPTFLQRIAGRPIDAVYTFLPIAYLLNDGELGRIEGPDFIKREMRRLFDSVFTRRTAFFVSIETLAGFYSTGKVIVPLIGSAEIEKERRIAYLRRFDPSVSEKCPGKARVVSGQSPKICAVCLKDFSLIYLFDEKSGREKIHCFHTGLFSDALADEAADSSMKLLEFNNDLWSAYMDGLSRGQVWI